MLAEEEFVEASALHRRGWSISAIARQMKRIGADVEKAYEGWTWDNTTAMWTSPTEKASAVGCGLPARSAGHWLDIPDPTDAGSAR